MKKQFTLEPLLKLTYGKAHGMERYPFRFKSCRPPGKSP
jgi:hypothetical protein